MSLHCKVNELEFLFAGTYGEVNALAQGVGTGDI